MSSTNDITSNSSSSELEEFDGKYHSSVLELFLHSLKNSDMKIEMELLDEYDIDEIEITAHYFWVKDDNRYRGYTLKQLVKIFRGLNIFWNVLVKPTFSLEYIYILYIYLV